MREPFPMLSLEPNSVVPLHRQVYEAIRQAILKGTLHAGRQLPSTRLLARELNVSRTTVLAAFESLLTEGYIEGRQGAGTFVCRVLPDANLSAETLAKVPRAKSLRASLGPSKRGKSLVQHSFWTPTRTQAFQLGIPALDEFPFEIWGKLWARRWRSRPADLLVQGDPAGYRPLREAIAQHASATRAVNCDPEQVIVVSGSRRALDLVARVLTEPGDTAWIEEPFYPGSYDTLQNVGLQLVNIPVDNQGLIVEEGIAREPGARLALVTPSHQYPLGVTLSLPRRLALIDWAKQTGGWILEDDYDSEYRFNGRPIPSLQGLDQSEYVIYLGSFSKVLYPSLRLGYLIVPKALVDAFVAAHAVLDGQSRLVEQAVLAEFMLGGHLARHLRRMRILYAQRQTTLIQTARNLLPGLLEIEPTDSGLHVIGRLPAGVSDRHIAQQAGAHGITLEPLSMCYHSANAQNGLLLGYAATSPKLIRKTIRQLAALLPTWM